jgi:hypothetical protein
LAIISTSCGSAASQKLLSVEEVVPRIDELNGRTVNVTGYLPECRGYECTLYRDKEDFYEWCRFLAAIREHDRYALPDLLTLGIGSSATFDFDAKAAPFTKSYVVITGRITNMCRLNGERACTDRSPDLMPIAIRAGSAPAR